MLTATVAGLVIGAHLHTLHLGNENDVPERFRNRDSTPGLYVRVPQWKLLGGEPTAGIYQNSIGRTSVYGGLTWETPGKRFAASLALASGYRIQRTEGPGVCPPGRYHNPPLHPCWFEHGKTHAHLMPIGGLSVAIPEVQPYLGVTPRVAWIGKGVHIAVERSF